MYTRALKGREEALGPKHTLTLDTVYNLGNLYYSIGRLAEAQKMYLRALEGYTDLEGDHESDISYLRAQLLELRSVDDIQQQSSGLKDNEFFGCLPKILPLAVEALNKSSGADSREVGNDKGTTVMIRPRKRDLLRRMMQIK